MITLVATNLILLLFLFSVILLQHFLAAAKVNNMLKVGFLFQYVESKNGITLLFLEDFFVLFLIMISLCTLKTRIFTWLCPNPPPELC